MYNQVPTKHLRAILLIHCQIILFISSLKYSSYPRYIFPIFMLLKYIKLRKSKTTYKLRAVPQSVIEHVAADKHLIDINNCILINSHQHAAIFKSTAFARLQSADLVHTTRLVQVMGTDLIKVSENELLMSYTLRHNWQMHTSTNRCKLLPVEVDDIKVCSEADISLITMQQQIGNSMVSSVLKNYFRNPKILYRNDLIAIDAKRYATEFYYTNLTLNEVEYLYFKCNKISITGVDDCLDAYLCVMGESSLKQSVDVQEELPQCDSNMKNITTADNYHELLINDCPHGLEKYCIGLEVALRPFLKTVKLKLNPIFLLSGPRGSGKHKLIASLSRRLGMKLCKVNNVDLSAQAYAQTEIKIKNVFFRASVCAPCLLVFDHFEEMCKNNEGQHDPRIINHFKNELETLFRSTEKPIILICVSNCTELPSDLSRMFLECVKIDAPTQEDREKMLEWILQKNGLNSSSYKDIAAKTHGFLFEDLQALVYYAKGGNMDNISIDDFEAAVDIMQNSYTESLGAPKVPKVQWSDVGGLEDVKQEIIKTINLPLKHPELLKTGLKRSGILLYGPPGTGKTLMAKAIATECGLCFLSVKGPELLNMYVGQSEQNVREVFEKARAASPCIIFFDELDSLAPNRGISGDSGGVMDRVVSQLLAEMDGLNKAATLFVIGATNRPDLIDPALLRPGRFDKLLYVGPCTDFVSKLGVLKALTRKFNFSEKMSLDKVVKTCPPNITGADFYGICSNAWMAAASRLVRKIEKGKVNDVDQLTERDVVVTFKDFEEAIKTTKPSVSAMDMAYFEKLRMELSANKK